jgi:hypothetical protein
MTAWSPTTSSRRWALRESERRAILVTGRELDDLRETTVLETIRDLGLELQVIFHKGAVMVLPTGANKARRLIVEAIEERDTAPA